MPYERKQEALRELIARALNDPTVGEAVRQYGLSDRRLSQQILDRQEEVWNAAGSEIENYNRAEAAASAAVANYQQQWNNWIQATRLFAWAPSLVSQPANDRLQKWARRLRNLLIFLMIICLGLAGALYFGLFTAIRPLTKENGIVRIGIALIVLIILSVPPVVVLGYLSRFHRQLRVIQGKAVLENDLVNVQAATEAAAKAVPDAVLKNGILPVLRELINQSTEPSYATLFPNIEPRGLDQIHDLFFRTEAWGRLTNVLQTMNGGSIGLAGPRGAGKTTILRWFCGERSWTLGNRDVLSVLVPAPSDYEARDFILYLYYAVCCRVLRKRQVEPEKIGWHLNSARWAHPIVMERLFRVLRFYLRFFAALLLTLGLSAATWQSLDGFANFFKSFDGRADVQSGASARAADHQAPHSGQPPANQPSTSAGQPPASVGFATALIASQAALAPFRAAVAPFGAALGLTAGRLFFGGIVLVLGYAFVSVWSQRNLQRQAWEKSPAAPVDLNKISGDPLLVDAIRRLQMIKFQQSYTEGWSGTLKFPILEGGVKRDLSVSERPLSLPEIVASFSSFLERLAGDFWVLIGIDELDKIHPEEKAEKFLNDIKVIFGLRGVFYLLSVSENALSAFERRGLPIRNVFDSAFDDVLHIGYLDFAGASGVLRQRVIGTPHPFLFLCYCVSGGLPRDLVRVCRNLVIEAQQRPDRSLAELCLAIVGADLLAKLHANEVVASDIPLERYVPSFLQELQSIRNAIAHAKPLSEPGGLAIDLRRGSDACFRPLPKLRGGDDLAKKAFNDLKQLRYELAVYLAYVSIIVAFFAAAKVGESDFKLADGKGFFDDIVKIRQSLAINPELAEVLARQLAAGLLLPEKKPLSVAVVLGDS